MFYTRVDACLYCTVMCFEIFRRWTNETEFSAKTDESHVCWSNCNWFQRYKCRSDARLVPVVVVQEQHTVNQSRRNACFFRWSWDCRETFVLFGTWCHLNYFTVFRSCRALFEIWGTTRDSPRWTNVHKPFERLEQRWFCFTLLQTFASPTRQVAQLLTCELRVTV